MGSRYIVNIDTLFLIILVMGVFFFFFFLIVPQLYRCFCKYLRLMFSEKNVLVSKSEIGAYEAPFCNTLNKSK